MSCLSIRIVSRLVNALRQIDDWPSERAVAVVCGRVEATHGDTGFEFPWASVSKLATALAMLVAAEEGIVDLDEPAGPPGASFRHLLAHASGLPFEAGDPIAPPGRRRIYSNYGFEVAAAFVEERAEMPFKAYFDHVWSDAGLAFAGSAGSGVRGTAEALRALAHELLAPARVAGETLDEATSVQFAGLDGVLPGFGRQSPNDWGLGFELRDGKHPHWTGTRNAASTFGHFGRSGTFLWVDPEARAALACLTDLEFGDWAKEAWPRLADGVLAELSRAAA
jgi:CubicO group peptidase (beta-lactamase class C family)